VRLLRVEEEEKEEGKEKKEKEKKKQMKTIPNSLIRAGKNCAVRHPV